jgi:hypothetical protein
MEHHFQKRLLRSFVQPRIKATKVIFKAGQTIGEKSLPDDLEVIPFCYTQLCKLEKLLAKCETQFNRPPLNPCDENPHETPSGPDLS